MTTPNSGLRLITAVFLAFVLFESSGQSDSRGSLPTSPPLAFRIVAPQSKICAGSALTVEIDLRNLSQHPLLVWPEAIKAIHFQAERPLPDQLLPEFDFFDEMGTPVSPGQTQGLVTLQPSHSYHYSIMLKNDFFKKEGYYKVSLEYDGSSPNPKSGGPSLFDGHLESNWLIFEVTECNAENALAVKDKYDPQTGRTDHTRARDAITHITMQSPTNVSLCKLVSKCTQYDQKRVRVRAEFISDGLEYSALVDPSKCSKGIQPWTSKTIDQHADIKALDVALTKGYRGTNDKQILGTFTGRYECGSATGTRGARILQLQSVEGIVVKPRKTEPSWAENEFPKDGPISMRSGRKTFVESLTPRHKGCQPNPKNTHFRSPALSRCPNSRLIA